MFEETAIRSLGALAHPHRLRAFRLLLRAHPGGCAAGEIAETLGIPPSSLSFHLASLRVAGLVSSERDRRRVVYRADLGGMRALMGYLTRDCCGGNPEICADLFAPGESARPLVPGVSRERVE